LAAARRFWACWPAVSVAELFRLPPETALIFSMSSSAWRRISLAEGLSLKSFSLKIEALVAQT